LGDPTKVCSFMTELLRLVPWQGRSASGKGFAGKYFPGRESFRAAGTSPCWMSNGGL
jgi:hypothetical protein